MKPATVAPRPRPKLPATRRSAVDAARCSAGTRVKVRTWPAVPRERDEHNQREHGEVDCVEEVERLERVEVMIGGCDDEARILASRMRRRRAKADKVSEL